MDSRKMVLINLFAGQQWEMKHISDKRLVSKIYKEQLKLNNKKKNFNNWIKDLIYTSVKKTCRWQTSV